MRTVYYLYHNASPVNSVPLSMDDVNEIKKHPTISIIVGRNAKEIPTKSLRVVRRIIM